MTFNSLVTLAAESGEHNAEGGINAWIVGGGALGILVLLLVGLLVFAGGREHS